MRQSYASLLITFLLFVGVACGGPITYNVTPIPAPFTPGDGGAINNSGQIVGNGPYYSYTTYSTTAGYQVSPPFSGFPFVEAFSINNSGVVGGELLASGIAEAFIGNTPLGTGGFPDTEGGAVNDAGQLAGLGYGGGSQEAFIATTSGYQFLQLNGSAFYGINSLGIATGYYDSQLIYGTTSGIIVIPLPTGWTSMLGVAINNAGNICGNGNYNANGGIQGAFYFNGTTVTNLAPNAFEVGVPDECINNSNQVVGTVTASINSESQAFLWDPVNGLQPLDGLVPAGWDITGVYGINDESSIVAYGSFNGGNPENLLLTLAAPEPGSLALAAVGLIGLALVRLRLNART